MTARPRLRPSEETLSVDGVDLNVAIGGPEDADPMLLLHGLAARWQAFGPVLPALLQSWRIVAPDFRGHGGSGHAPGTYSLTRFLQDTEQVVAAHCDGPPVIYGHSLGGWIGLGLAATQPVRGIALGDTAITPLAIDIDLAINYLADMPMALKSLSTAANQLDPAVMEQVRAGETIVDYEPEELLAKITCPVLLIQGDSDAGGLMTDDDVALARRLLPNVTHVRLDGVGHAMHVQDSGRVLDAIESFLEEL